MDFDSKTALVKIIRFNKTNPVEHETVGPLLLGEAYDSAREAWDAGYEGVNEKREEEEE